MSDNEVSVFKKKEGRIIITLFLVVVAFLSMMNAYEKFAPSIIGNNKSVYEGGECGLIYFRDKRIDKMKADITKTDSCIYSDGDIENAIKSVKEYYKQQKNNIGLCALRFNEEETEALIRSYCKENSCQSENVMVIYCSYNVYDVVGDEEYGYHENEAVTLVRDKSAANGGWSVCG